MSDEHTPTLQDIAADRGWWSVDARTHYRELAHWLLGIAAKCRLPFYGFGIRAPRGGKGNADIKVGRGGWSRRERK
jgi:hypothetical protein